MDGARNQFLSRAGFAQKQHRRIAGPRFPRDSNMAESRTLPHNSFKVNVATDFIFQIQLFLRKLVL